MVRRKKTPRKKSEKNKEGFGFFKVQNGNGLVVIQIL